MRSVTGELGKQTTELVFRQQGMPQKSRVLDRLYRLTQRFLQENGKPAIPVAVGIPTRSVAAFSQARWAQAGVIPGAVLEETPRGPVWMIPQSSSDTFEQWRPKRGRPQKPENELKQPRRRNGQ